MSREPGKTEQTPQEPDADTASGGALEEPDEQLRDK